MATMEKPKQKKKKRVKSTSLAEAPAEMNAQWSNADIEFPSTSTSDEIEILSPPDESMCADLAELQLAEATEATAVSDDGIEKETDSSAAATEAQELPDAVENGEEHVDQPIAPAAELAEAVAVPSAPTFDDLEETAAQAAPASVPAHLELSHLPATKCETPTDGRIVLQPFTSAQLKELYDNPELRAADAFEADFIGNELSSPHRSHPLHDLIKKYSQSRYNLKVNMLDLQGFIRAFQENSQKLWIIENRITSYEGNCADGERVRKNELYEFAVLNEQMFQKIAANLNNMIQLVCYSFMTNLFACESYKTQIEQYMREMFAHPAFAQIRTSTPVTLATKYDASALEALSDVRVTISILFGFLRRQVPDKEFSNDIKKWLEKMAAFYVRMATWQDHLFLVYHVLRCPPGIASWAIPLVQLPRTSSGPTASPYARDDINHCMTFLKVLLLPTKQRNEFLAQLQSTTGPIDATAEDLWIIIDSDGEEDSTPAGECATLKENDLIALLNQVPFEHLFSCMLFSSLNGDHRMIDAKSISGYHLLKFIAFSTQLVGLLGEGLKTYANEKYRQFGKLLGRLVRHAVQYVSDMHAIFKSVDVVKDRQLYARIQIELDTFVLRSSNFIYLSRFLGAWQYLVILPFSELHISTVWKLYHMLTAGFSHDTIENVTDDFRAKVIESDFLDRFNDTVIDVPSEDMYYLLQTFASMAMARDIGDIEFIKTVTTNLFCVGFTNAITRDNCYKIVRDLLVNITSTHTELISCLLYLLKKNLKLVDKYGPYLFKSLPLDEWRPPIDIFEIAANWLLNYGIETGESAMARTIFSRLNWNFERNTNDLFLSHDIHMRMASLIVDVSTKHAPETIGSSGITESVRQVSSLVKGQTPQQQFSAWCWNMISVVRLHAFDQGPEFVCRAVRNPVDALRIVSELERLPSISQGVLESRPIAIYISMLTTAVGHSVPLVCQKGFGHMQSLLNDYRYPAVIRCVQLTTPFFLDCPESLSRCAAFQAIIATILQADRTYLRMAKDLISADFPGPVVQHFANMIQAQIIDYFNYGLPTPTILSNMWLNTLLAGANWYKDPGSVYVVDIILRIAYQFTDSWLSAKSIFKSFCMEHNEQKANISSSFIPFLGGSQSSGFFAIAASASTPWLALLTLEIEHEMFEMETKLWPELIRQMNIASAKTSLDSTVKATAKLVKCHSFAANALVIYKMANLILSCSHHEELLPIFGQSFFQLYLTRIRFSADEQHFADAFGVADKFYDHNVSLMKRLKRFFADGAAFEAERSKGVDDEQQAEHYNSRARIYTSFGIWLEETRLNKIAQLRVESFPPAYDLYHLAMVFANNTVHWTEFVHMANIRKAQKEAADAWLRNCLRYSPPSKGAGPALKPPRPTNPSATVANLLNSYDAPVPAPDVPIEPVLIKKLPLAELKRTAFRTMQTDFRQLIELSRIFHMDVQELSSLDSTYKEMFRSLHANKVRKECREIRCSSIVSSNMCKGSLFVTIDLPYHEINEDIKDRLEKNRDRHEQLINKLISAPKPAQILPIVQIQLSIRRLLDTYQFFKQIRDEQQMKEISSIANQFFYYMVDSINENINSFHPAQDLCTVALSSLGIFLQDNQNSEGMNLLRTALKRPDLIKPISDLFVPSATCPEVFLQLYKFIVDSHLNNCDPKVLFVLLSKFDVNSWLATFKPKLADINQLVQLIVQGLECWNKTEAALIQGVLRRHLIHIFVFDFPEHYGEVLLIVLRGCSENKLMPSILLELLNTIYKMAQCPEIDANADNHKIKEDILYFAANQKLFSYTELYETIALFARHFQNERLQHGLNGLYPIHKDHCKWISIMFETFGHALIVSSVHANPGALSDTLIDWIWPSVCEMFSPWLFPYYPQNMPNLPANWIRQFNTPILLPWSDLYLSYAQMLLTSFIDCIHFMLDTFPACDLILSNIFYWYEVNFGNVSVPRHVLQPTHTALTQLPWNRLRPTPLNIHGFNRLLQQYLPDCHSFLGHIFLRVNWTPWLYNNINQWDFATRTNILSTLLLMFVKLSYEPNVRENSHLIVILQETIQFPWYLLDYKNIEATFDWYVMSTEPSSILCLNSEHSAVDNSILSLLQTASSMIASPSASGTEHAAIKSQMRAKRILYIKSIVRLLRLCGSKYQQLLTTADGSKSFNAAIFNLLTLISSIASHDKNNGDAVNMMIEVVSSIQLQGEFTSRIFVEAISSWQSSSGVGNMVLTSTLNALGACKSWTINVLLLLESTISHYFRYTEVARDQHNPTWSVVFERLGPALPPFDLQQLFDSEHLLCVHIYAIYKLRHLADSGEKITYLENIGKLLENFKSTLNTESKLAVIWGLLIVCGSKLLETNPNAREPLLLLARYLRVSSSVSDSWGEGILGAIGLKKETVSNKLKIAAKCLSCIIFSLFLDNKNQQAEYEKAMSDLSKSLKSKRFSDVRTLANDTIDIIEKQKDSLANTKENVCTIIRIFYDDHFMTSLEEVWSF